MLAGRKPRCLCYKETLLRAFFASDIYFCWLEFEACGIIVNVCCVKVRLMTRPSFRASAVRRLRVHMRMCTILQPRGSDWEMEQISITRPQQCHWSPWLPEFHRHPKYSIP